MAGLAIISAAISLSGCSTITYFITGRQAVEARKLQRNEVQLQTMRLADQYVGRVIDATQIVANASNSQRGRLDAQGWAVLQANSAYTSASGPRPNVDLLDLVALASLSRRYSERWTKASFDADPEPLVAVHRQLEQEILAYMDSALGPEASKEVRATIDAWDNRSTGKMSIVFMRFTEFARQAGRPIEATGNSPTGLLQLIGVDPLASLDPAVAQLEQSRLLAERAIYYTQRLPLLVDLQLRHSTLRLLATPEVNTSLADATRISAAAQQVAATAAQMPDVIARERAALLDGIWKGLAENETRTRELVTELHGAITASDEAAKSLRSTIQALDALMARFEKPGREAAAEPSRPFDITEYGQAATDIGEAATRLQALIASADARSPAALKAVQDAATELRGVADSLFWRALILVVLLPLLCLVAALAFVRLAPRVRQNRS